MSEEVGQRPRDARGALRASSSSAGSATYALLVLAVVNMFNYMDRTAFAVLAEPIKVSLQLSDTQVGALSGIAFALLYAIMGLPLARLADRTRRASLIASALAFWSAATAFCGVAQSYLQLFALRVSVGVGEAGCIPTAHSLISDYFTPQRRAFAMGIFQAGGSFGIALGALAAGLVGDLLGWRWAFVALGAPGVVVAAVALWTMAEPPRSASSAAPVSLTSAMSVLLRKRTFRGILIAYSLALFGFYGIAQWTPALFIRTFAISGAAAGLLFAATVGLGSVLGAVLGAICAPSLVRRDRRYELWMPGAAYLASAPLFGLAPFAETAAQAGLLLFGAVAVSSTGLGAGMSSVQSIAPATMRATAAALVMLTSAILGQGAGPFVVGWLSDVLAPNLGANSLRVALLAPAAVLAVSAAAFAVAAQSLRQDIAPGEIVSSEIA